MQFFACSSGLSARIGSSDATSSPAAQSFPLFSASARSCSTISPPRLLLMRIAPSFIFAMLSRLMIPAVSGNSGQCSETTSASASSVSSGTYSAIARPSSVSVRLYASTRIPIARAMRPTCRPMRPKPMMPIVIPSSSISGVSQKQKSAHAAQRPSCTASAWSPTCIQISSSSAMANCATAAVP